MSQVNQIKDAINIVDEVGQRLDLKKAGSSYKALCPFHSEKTPSFFVSPQLQRYRCFGCGASGDVIEFLEKYEGMTFLEALRYLADQANIKLEEYTRTQDDQTRAQMLEALQLASKYYSYLLTEHDLGKPALRYLKERGVTKASIDLFNVGYALPAWDGLLNFLTKKKSFKPKLIEKTGLVIRNKTGRYYDRFRNRVVFPLKNHRGQIRGFSGRILSDNNNSDEQQPKYINTPETQLYHKSKLLYGYSELFQQIRKKKSVIVTEGEFDVISSNQAHVSNIVAIKGSALTIDQVKLLSRVVSKVLLSLDADEAGVEATKRAINVVRDTDLDLRVIDLSEVKEQYSVNDADELIQFDPKLWKKAVKNSIAAYDFLIRVTIDKFDVSTAVGRRHIINELAPVLDQVTHQVERDFYIRKLADQFQVSPSILESDIKRFGQNRDSNKDLQAEKTTAEIKVGDSLEKLEDYLLFLLFNSDNEEVQARARQLKELEPQNPQAVQILTKLLNFEESYSLKKFAATLAEDLKAALMAWTNYPHFKESIDDLKIAEEWTKIVQKYHRKKVKQQIENLNQKLADFEKEESSPENTARMDELLEKIVELQNSV